MSIELVPLTDCTGNDLRRFSYDVHSAVNDRQTRKLLKCRGLLGVIARHEKHEMQSQHSLKRGRARMKDGDIDARVVVDWSGKAVGMTTIIPNLPLYRQRSGLLPPKIARLSPWFTDVMPVAEHKKGDVEISAWVRAGELATQEVISTIYGQQLEVARDIKQGTSAWTIEPYGRENTEEERTYHLAIEAAGFHGKDLGRYDDMERGWSPVPMSILYRADFSAL